MFLRDHAPDVLTQLEHGLALVTTRCSCEYLSELSAFDEITLRMKLGGIALNKITLLFEYWRGTNGERALAARGEQQVACMQREGDRLYAAPFPASLSEALRAYTED